MTAHSAALLTALLAASTAVANDAPRVLADIAPIHSLVAMVMEGVPGTDPGVIVQPGTSPHDSALRPSEAEAISQAEVVIWTGPTLLPWLGEAVGTLAPDAHVVTLLEAPGWTPMTPRDASHLAEAGGGHEHEHEEAEHEHEAGHEGAVDPHAWLDPAVAAAWLDPIAEALAAEDPANAASYRANADAATIRLAALGEETRARLSPLAGRGYAVGHDAYQYFERASGLPAAWAIAPASGAQPSPGDMGSLRDAVLGGDVVCVLGDSESDPAWAATLTEGTSARTAVVDPEGLFLEPGPDLYPTLIGNLTDALVECLG